MARYQGIRKQTRQKLNRRVYCGSYPIKLRVSAEQALERALECLRKDPTDGRTVPGKHLLAAIDRVAILQRELTR